MSDARYALEARPETTGCNRNNAQILAKATFVCPFLCCGVLCSSLVVLLQEQEACSQGVCLLPVADVRPCVCSLHQGIQRVIYIFLAGWRSSDMFCSASSIWKGQPIHGMQMGQHTLHTEHKLTINDSV